MRAADDLESRISSPKEVHEHRKLPLCHLCCLLLPLPGPVWDEVVIAIFALLLAFFLSLLFFNSPPQPLSAIISTEENDGGGYPSKDTLNTLCMVLFVKEPRLDGTSASSPSLYVFSSDPFWPVLLLHPPPSSS